MKQHGPLLHMSLLNQNDASWKRWECWPVTKAFSGMLYAQTDLYRLSSQMLSSSASRASLSRLHFPWCVLKHRLLQITIVCLLLHILFHDSLFLQHAMLSFTLWHLFSTAVAQCNQTASRLMHDKAVSLSNPCPVLVTADAVTGKGVFRGMQHSNLPL